ncbi:MAG: Trm112 family protein [Pseudomonadota bacterium]
MADAPTEFPDRASGVDPRLLEILVCPLSRAPLEYDRAKNELISRKAGLAYHIRDGLPILLEEEARPLDGSAA